MKDLEILKSAGMTDHDARLHLQKGVVIYDLPEYLDHFDEYTAEMDDEDKDKLRAFLEAGKPGCFCDNDLTEYNGVKYYIEYCL